jgi:hypothetical protein
MKDRIKRTQTYKAPHRLRHAAFTVALVSLFGSSLATAFLIHYSQENRDLTAQIENYSVQVDLIERSNENAKNSADAKMTDNG